MPFLKRQFGVQAPVASLPVGPIGPPSPRGPSGNPGLRGSVGASGATSQKGDQGIQGVLGNDGAPGDQGDQGDQGDPGPGVASGGTTGQVLKKNTDTDYDTGRTASGGFFGKTKGTTLGDTAGTIDVVYGSASGTAAQGIGATPAGTGDVVGPASSVDSEIALFSGTGGKTIKRASTSGILKGTSGVIGAASAGTDFQGIANVASSIIYAANTINGTGNFSTLINALKIA